MGVAICQEPNQKKGKIMYINTEVTQFTGGPEPRACILMNKQMSRNFTCVNQLCTNDQVVISTRLGDKRLLIASVYMPYDSVEHPVEKVEQLLDYSRSKSYELVIGCDANSHNEAWGSTDNNVRGEELLDFIISEDLQICNIGTEPTFSSGGREEVLDITLCSTNMYERITGWKVNTENSSSDHNMIEFSISTEETHTREEYRNIRNTRWKEYKENLGKYLGEKQLEQLEEVDELEEHIRKSIRKAYHSSCSTTVKKTKFKVK